MFRWLVFDVIRGLFLVIRFCVPRQGSLPLIASEPTGEIFEMFEEDFD